MAASVFVKILCLANTSIFTQITVGINGNMVRACKGLDICGY